MTSGWLDRLLDRVFEDPASTCGLMIVATGCLIVLAWFAVAVALAWSC